jgi:hypothetical protein
MAQLFALAVAALWAIGAEPRLQRLVSGRQIQTLRILTFEYGFLAGCYWPGMRSFWGIIVAIAACRSWRLRSGSATIRIGLVGGSSDD